MKNALTCRLPPGCAPVSIIEPPRDVDPSGKQLNVLRCSIRDDLHTIACVQTGVTNLVLQVRERIHRKTCFQSVRVSAAYNPQRHELCDPPVTGTSLFDDLVRCGSATPISATQKVGMSAAPCRTLRHERSGTSRRRKVRNSSP